MAKGLPRSTSRGRKALQEIVKDILKLKDFPVTVTTVTTADGFGSATIAPMAEGNVLFLGATANLSAFSSDTDLLVTYNPSIAVGTTATADLTLSGTEINILPITALGAATARQTPIARAASTGVAAGSPLNIFDNTPKTTNYVLNVTVPTADMADSQTAIILFTGVIRIAYIVLGDD